MTERPCVVNSGYWGNNPFRTWCCRSKLSFPDKFDNHQSENVLCTYTATVGLYPKSMQANWFVFCLGRFQNGSEWPSRVLVPRHPANSISDTVPDLLEKIWLKNASALSTATCEIPVDYLRYALLLCNWSCWFDKENPLFCPCWKETVPWN